jgi:hypothetical protein
LNELADFIEKQIGTYGQIDKVADIQKRYAEEELLEVTAS